MKKVALMAIGLPGSGKTTLLKPLAEKYGLAYISRDDMREELFGNTHEQSRNKEVWQEANRRTAEALASGQGVVLDSTFLERWKRADMISFLRMSGADRIVAVVFDIDPETARQRNRDRDRIVPDETMDWMLGKRTSEPPKLEEGFDALYTHEDIEKIASVELA